MALLSGPLMLYAYMIDHDRNLPAPSHLHIDNRHARGMSTTVTTPRIDKHFLLTRRASLTVYSSFMHEHTVRPKGWGKFILKEGIPKKQLLRL